MKRAQVVGFYKLDFDSEFRQRVMKQVISAAVEVIRRDDVIAGLGDIQNRQSRSRLAAGNGESADPAVDGGDALLQHVIRRIHDPRINVAELSEPEEIGGVLGALELVRRGLVNGYGPGTRRRVGLLSTMKGQSFHSQFRVDLAH